MKSVPAACGAFTVLALCGLALLGAAPGPGLRGGVAGRVVEAGPDPRGVAGAIVTASDPWAGPLDTLITDARGDFAFKGLPAGRAVLAARARGYAAGGALTVPVRAGQDLGGARLKLARSATLEGRVVDREGRPLAGAEVTALDAKAMTGPDGRYRLQEVRPELLRVRAQTAVHRPSMSPELRLKPGELRRLPDLVLSPGRTVSGRVVGPDGRPLAGVRVETSGRSVKSDARGEFRLGGLEAGGSIYAWRQGLETASLDLPKDSLDLSGLTLHLSREPQGEREMMLSMSRDTWAPGERITATAWAPGTDPVRVRVEDARGRVVHRGAQAGPRADGGRALLVLPALPPGEYVLTAAVPGVEKSMGLRVSEVALISEQWPSGVRVRAVRLADGAPVAGLPLTGDAGALGSTDAAGLLQLPAGSMGAVASADPKRPARLELSPPPAAPSAVRLAALTDRPALRPGGALGVKVIARREQDGALVAVADSLVKLELRGAESGPVERQGRLDAAGVRVDSLTVPAKLQFGQAELVVTAAGVTETRELPLTARPTPTLTVQVTPDRELAMPGDTVRFLIRARREDGLPASSVRFTASEQEWPSEYDWGEDRGFRGIAWLGLSRREVLVADERGEAVFTEVLPELMAGDLDLHLSVVAQEPGSEAMGSSAAVHALASARHVAIPMVTNDGPGKPLSASFKVQALPRRTVPNAPLHLDLYRMERHPRRFEARWLESADLSTGADGEVAWRSRARGAAGAEYRLRASSADSLGRVATAECSWWVPGSSEGAEAEVTFQLAAARDTLDTDAPEARLRIRAGFAGVAHVALAGREPLSWLPDVRFRPGVTEFAVPRALWGAGGLRVAAYASRGGDVLFGEATCVARRPSARITVELTPEKPLLAPRDTLRLVVRTLDFAGRPVPAEVDLAAYDRGMLGFGPDNNPDLMEAFWRPRPLPLQVRSSVRRGEQAGGKDAEGEVRRDFRDVAFWAPRLRTGADGLARVGFRVPDNLTTWRITAHALGESSSVGRGQADVTVRRPVALQVSRPEALVAGDSVVLRVLLRVAAGEPERRFSDWRIEVRGGSYLGSAPDVVASPARPAEVSLPIRVNADAETLRVTVVARSAGLSDGVERVIPVERAERTVFGRGDEPGVTWDSTTVLRWQAPALAAVIRGGGLGRWLHTDPGPERVARVAMRENLARLGLERLLGRPEEAGGGGEVEGEDEDGSAVATGASGASGGSAPWRPSYLPLGRERQRMFAAIRPARALLRADNSLDLQRACDVLLASAAGRDTVDPGTLKEIQALALRVRQAKELPRVSQADRVMAGAALVAVDLRFGLHTSGSVSDTATRSIPDGGNAMVPLLDARGDDRVVATTVLWDMISHGGGFADSVRARAWLGLLGGRGRGWAGLWPVLAASHLEARDVAAPPGSGPLSEEQLQAFARPEVLPAAPAPDAPGAIRVTHHRGRAPLSVAPDTSGRGGLTVRLYRDLPDTDAWGEPDTRQELVRGPVKVGETLRMEVCATRPVECDELELVAPLCGAFDTRPPVGTEGGEGKPCWTLDRRLRGRIEAPAWRPEEPGAVVWEATLRVTHAGRFTLLPPVLHSTVIPGLYRSAGGPIRIDAVP